MRSTGSTMSTRNGLWNLCATEDFPLKYEMEISRAPHKKSKAPSSRALRADAVRSIQQILEIADGVFEKNPQASLQEVATAAGLTRMTIYRHFESREALIERMLIARYAQI